MPRRVVASLICVVGASIAFACSFGEGPALLDSPDAATSPPLNLSSSDATSGAVDVDLGEAFAIDGLVPSHGPFTGGTRVTISGRGFPSTLRVWIGGTELAASAIVASDPTRAAVETPPGGPGPADVVIRNDATSQERTLTGGFVYDAFVVQPNQGATTGGTRVSIVGNATHFDAKTTVTIDGKACEDLDLRSATQIDCTTPADAAGAKDVTIVESGETIQADDAFTYSDSTDGYRGGLSGGILSGTLNVLVFDAWTGLPVPDAYAIAGSLTQLTNSSGLAFFLDESLTGAVTVTVAATCHQPLTFVADPVDTVTAYITPTLNPSCLSGDPPSSGGGTGIQGGEITGELVFPGVEFAPGAWTVPQPTKPTERQAAYVFSVAGSPTQGFSLPDPSTAALPTVTGSRGYPYTFITSPGNATIYALAGIEDRTAVPPTFVAYAMGVARGIQVPPGGAATAIDIPMSTLLDHAVTLAPTPPAPAPRGPDRLMTNVAVTVGQLGYAILPNGSATSLLPVVGDVSFVGVPALDGTLTGEEYAIAASAGTGPSQGAPGSVVGQVLSTDSNDPIAIGGFLTPPTLLEPASTPWPGTHVQATVTGAIDLLEVQIASGDGLVTWTIVAPGSVSSFDLPDLRPLVGEVGLISGPLATSLWAARIDSFTYGTLRTGQMGPGGWDAYAYDDLPGVY